MSPVSKTLAISAPPEKILGIILDIEAYPEWQKEVQTASVDEKDDQGRPARSTMSVSAMGQTASYSLAYDYPDATTVVYHLVEGEMMTKNDATYRVVAGADGESELTMDLDFAVKWPLPEFMITQVTMKAVNDMLKAIKRSAEG